ncbi:DUF4138 domain-containing protein [Chryseobacterium sp. CT-SW4]|uniref:DUF4138 domain-containing protein n=1 Tax=Chryseobacterium sp. SW-1 TaxID=3157343 RepID=UPI003B023640
MKYIVPLFLLLGAVTRIFAQTSDQNLGIIQQNKVFENRLPVIFITKDVNVLFRSPEKIQFVDLSSEKLVGDLPAENLVRLKISKFKSPENITDSLQIFNKEEIHYFEGENIGVITVVGQSFMAQYKLVYTSNNLTYGSSIENKLITNVQITEQDMQPLEYPSTSLSDFEMKKYAQKIIKYGDKYSVRKSSDFKMGAIVNNLYAYDDYIFLDITFTNTTNLPYEIGNVEFSIDDKKIYKATNNQSITIKPVFQLYEHSRFKKQFRNIYVLKKFTFPNNKILNIRIYENGISGRTLTTAIKYNDLLEADTF